MKRVVIIFAMLAAGIAARAQDADTFKSNYERQVRMVGNAGVGVETILDRWEQAFPDDPQMHESRHKYYLAKSAGSSVVIKETKRYLGKEPVLALKDSSGTEHFYFEVTVFADSLFALGQQAIDRAIQLSPSDLGYRVDKITALVQYEKDSPDMATQELLKLIDYHKTAKPSWVYFGLPVDESTFKQAVQEYCYNFFQFGTPGSYDAFKTVSEAMHKLYPKDTAYIDNIGSYWLVHMKNDRKALSWYNKALKIDPNDYIAAKNCVILARKEKNVKLEKKYLPALMASTSSESERAACKARLESLGKKR